jgi:hypothetical protein
MYLLNDWGSPVPPQSLGKPCTSSVTGEALYLLNHWGSHAPPQSLEKHCKSLRRYMASPVIEEIQGFLSD